MKDHRWIGMLGLAVALVGAACGDSDATPTTACRESAATTTGAVADADLDEISGLVGSRASSGVLWVHNDSGDGPFVYALDASGQTLATFELEGVTPTDWEDIAIGPGPDPGRSYLYVADIGDNRASRSRVTIYRVAEPPVAEGSATLSDVATIRLTYPNGPRDAETLLVDPDTGGLIIVSKAITGRARFYRAAATPGPTVTMMEEVATLQLGLGDFVTGGDLSADRLAIRTYSEILVWRIAADDTVESVLDREPCSVTVGTEEQGEAVGFGDGQLWTISEGTGAVVYSYPDPLGQ